MNFVRAQTLVVAAVLAMTPIAGVSQRSGGTMGGGSTGMPGSPAGPGSDGMPDRFGSRGNNPTADTHRTRERALQRAHREVLDLDPHGSLVVRSEVVALVSSPEALAAALANGFAVRRRHVVDGLESDVIVFEAPKGLSLSRSIKRLRKLDPDGTYDFNHVYLTSGETGASAVAPPPGRQINTPQTTAAGVASHRVGLVDGGVEASHPALRSANVHSHGCDGSMVPSLHGTEVASRLLEGLDEPPGRSAPVDLFIADIYCDRPTGGSVDSLVGALAWLVHEAVPVINLSVVGPRNLLLQRAVEIAAGRGHLMVAAVGNDGPAAPPLYPASFPQVIAVTGVDGSGKVLVEAGRRGHVDFAAPGADVLAASLPSGFAWVRGTSYAAPIVAGQLAQRLDRTDPALAERAVAELAATAIDLGERGVDPVYGSGCVGCDLRDKKD